MLLKCSVIDSIFIRHKKQNSHDRNDLDVADTEITNMVLSSSYYGNIPSISSQKHDTVEPL